MSRGRPQKTCGDVTFKDLCPSDRERLGQLILRLQNYKDQLQHANSTILAQKDSITALELELCSLRGELEDSRCEIDRLKQQLQAGRAVIQEKQIAVDDATLKLDSVRKELAALKLEVDEHRSQSKRQKRVQAKQVQTAAEIANRCARSTQSRTVAANSAAQTEQQAKPSSSWGDPLKLLKERIERISKQNQSPRGNLITALDKLPGRVLNKERRLVEQAQEAPEEESDGEEEKLKRRFISMWDNIKQNSSAMTSKRQSGEVKEGADSPRRVGLDQERLNAVLKSQRSFKARKYLGERVSSRKLSEIISQLQS